MLEAISWAEKRMKRGSYEEQERRKANGRQEGRVMLGEKGVEILKEGRKEQEGDVGGY